MRRNREHRIDRPSGQHAPVGGAVDSYLAPLASGRRARTVNPPFGRAPASRLRYAARRARACRRSRGRRRSLDGPPAAPVVGDLELEDALTPADVDGGARRRGVLDRVRQGLLHDPVGAQVERRWHRYGDARPRGDPPRSPTPARARAAARCHAAGVVAPARAGLRRPGSRAACEARASASWPARSTLRSDCSARSGA